ncbi:MAG TPA: DUF885 domain-containing protein [Candidatus Limnocylindria bacterium]|nr:DUF885 domain-containing protein [Candidatus Limnocylindria bacterium]
MTGEQPGALDERFEALVRERFDSVMARFPVFATYLGIAEHDHRLADGSREAAEQDLLDSRRFLVQLEALEPERLSPLNLVERELALLATRQQIFDDDVHRLWERRVSAADELGDGVFLLFSRGSRPMAQRLEAIGSRLEAAPRLIAEQRARLGPHPVRLWNELELEAVRSLPSLFTEVAAAAAGEFGQDHHETVRIRSAAQDAARSLDEYAGWIEEQLGSAGNDFALGPERYAELIGLRAFDGLDTQAILEIGEQQLAENRAARRSVAAEIDAQATEQEVLERVKADQPADFESALETYRRAMAEARAFVVEHDIASLPPGEDLEIIATPEYLRSVMPFAAYFTPPKFEPGAKGIYIVTPSVDGDPRAMREHNYASIYNTSIHEAYPGHHQQLTAAMQHPSLVRLLLDAPEFVEGWAMYCEQMMREQGFDDGPERRLMMYTDAIWRACRIVLDVKLHLGQIGTAEATDYLVEQTGFERPNAAAEVNRYTYTPTYQLSYLLGKVLLLRLRSDEQARLGDRFSLKGFHDALLGQGSLPISFQRRLLQEEPADA